MRPDVTVTTGSFRILSFHICGWAASQRSFSIDPDHCVHIQYDEPTTWESSSDLKPGCATDDSHHTRQDRQVGGEMHMVSVTTPRLVSTLLSRI